MAAASTFAEGRAHDFVGVPPEALAEIEEPACRAMLGAMRRSVSVVFSCRLIDSLE